MSKGKIVIKCRGAGLLSLDEIEAFQGKLKELSKESLKKLKSRIINRGFAPPFFIWKDEGGSNKILDGHQRKKALLDLKKDGWELPEKFPVDYIEAESEKEAKEKLLEITSQYGELTEEGLLSFLEKADLEIQEISLNVEFAGLNLDDIISKFSIDDEEEGKRKKKERSNIVECPKCGHRWEE